MSRDRGSFPCIGGNFGRIGRPRSGRCPDPGTSGFVGHGQPVPVGHGGGLGGCASSTRHTELPPRLAGGGRWNGDVFRQHHGPGHAGHNGFGPRIADRIGAHDPRRRRVDDWRVGRLGLASASTLTLKPSRCRQEQVIQKTDQRKGHNRIDHVRHDVRILEPNEVAIRVKNEPCESDGDGSNRAL